MHTTKCESTKMGKLVEIYTEGVTKWVPLGRLRNKGSLNRLRTGALIMGLSRNSPSWKPRSDLKPTAGGDQQERVSKHCWVNLDSSHFGSGFICVSSCLLVV